MGVEDELSATLQELPENLRALVETEDPDDDEPWIRWGWPQRKYGGLVVPENIAEEGEGND